MCKLLTGPRKTNPEENVRLLKFIINVQKITKCYALATMANTGHTAQSFYMIISLEKLCHELGEHLRIIFFHFQKMFILFELNALFLVFFSLS